MALNSPGVQVTIIDESNYTPAPTGTVPFIVLATEQDKLTPAGDIAEYTTAANAGKVFLVTSQRELINKYGKPNFLVSQGTPVHGYELNEYGLLAAYSALGVSNAAWIMRADIDLNELVSSLTRPSAPPATGTLWLDTDLSRYGIFEWNSATGFHEISTSNVIGEGQLTVITDTDLIAANLPLSSIGKPGDYAIDTTDINNPVFYKAAAPSPVAGEWVAIGSTDWFTAWPTVVGTVADPILATSSNLVINGSNVVLSTGNTVTEVVSAINAATIGNVTAAETPDGSYLAIYTSNANMTIAAGNVALLSDLGLTAGTFNRPRFIAGKHTQAPAGGVWTSTGSDPRPTGSVWFKTTTPNNGAQFVVNRYNATTGVWTETIAPVYASDADALYNMDPIGGGTGIAVNSVYVQSVVSSENTAASYATWDDPEYTFKLFTRVSGVSKGTGLVANPVFASSSKSFTVRRSIPGQAAMASAVTVTFSGNTAASFVEAVNNASISYVVAAQETDGKVTLTHTAGGAIEVADTVGTVFGATGLGFTNAGVTEYGVGVRASDINAGAFWISNWREAEYTVSGSTPAVDPLDGTLWYYNSPTEFDIMINTGTGWAGYLLGGVDSRGFTLSATDPAGPLVSASEPLLQSDSTALVNGDLWINTSDLEDFPKIYRRESGAWVLIDNTDHTSENGIVFADARWGTSGSVDAVTDDIPTIVSLLSSSYTDSDCPSYSLYPRGTLLFNTRRSGLNVKQFVVDHFADADVPPAYLNAWVSASGNDSNGIAYMGRKAQRAVVVARMASAISSSVEVTEETRNFNIMVAPGYAELATTLTQLNVNRKETAFILVDSPMRLAADSNTLDSWARNLNTATDNNEDGFVSYYEYMAGYYPSGYTRDLDGNNVVVPASHMVLRTMIRSDQKSYPWFAPAGLRRGVVDNASAIGYIDAQSGLFQSIGLGNSLRDVLYLGKVNPISVLVNSGIVIYGQKTRSSLDSALDRINVSRLVVYLRRQLDLIARQYIFEPNDEITRREIKNQIEKELNSIQSNRGIYDYAVVCDLTNNTPDRIDRNELWVDVAIEPVKSVDFIYIPVRIKNTGDIEAGL